MSAQFVGNYFYVPFTGIQNVPRYVEKFSVGEPVMWNFRHNYKSNNFEIPNDYDFLIERIILSSSVKNLGPFYYNDTDWKSNNRLDPEVVLEPERPFTLDIHHEIRNQHGFNTLEKDKLERITSLLNSNFWIDESCNDEFIENIASSRHPFTPQFVQQMYRDVLRYMNRGLKRLKKHSHFNFNLSPTGSFYESTIVTPPFEMDFMLEVVPRAYKLRAKKNLFTGISCLGAVL